MKKTKKIGIGLVICGLRSTVGAGFTYAFQQTILVPYHGDSSVLYSKFPELTNPYRDYTSPLILVTVVLLVLGFAFIVYKPKIKDYKN